MLQFERANPECGQTVPCRVKKGLMGGKHHLAHLMEILPGSEAVQTSVCRSEAQWLQRKEGGEERKAAKRTSWCLSFGQACSCSLKTTVCTVPEGGMPGEPFKEGNWCSRRHDDWCDWQRPSEWSKKPFSVTLILINCKGEEKVMYLPMCLV